MTDPKILAAVREKRRKNAQTDDPNQNWKKALHVGARKQILTNVHNALLTLQNDPELRNLLAYDQMLSSPMVVKSKPTELTSDDITDIQVRLQITGIRSIGFDTTKQAILRHSKEHAYHPVREQFNKLAANWDGTPRIDTWLINYAGCKDNEYHRGISAMFLRQVVKRIYEPGCKADYMLILEGPQGVEKSKIIRILAGSERYFDDNLPDLTRGKECSQHLRGLMLVEIPEMDTFTRADINTLKAFLTRTHERYRPPFEPAEVSEPRQCSFVGTANKETYLRDETGNRRYWSVRCGTINAGNLIADRDQIIAEAVVSYRRGDPTYPSRKWECDHAQPQQDERFEEDPWTDAVHSYLTGRKKITIPEILTSVDALDVPRSQVDPGKARRVAAILRKANWRSNRDKNERWWSPPDDTQ